MATWAWGSNINGSLGLGSTPPPTVLKPTLMSGDFVQATNGHFLDRNGSVYAFSARPFDRPDTYSTPTLVPGLSNIVKIDSRDNNVLALDANGVLWGWGSQIYTGSLGIGDIPYYPPRTVPVLVSTNVADMACGQTQSDSVWNLILHNDGRLQGAGFNSYGALGQTDLLDSNVWRDINPPSGRVVKMATGRGGSGWSLLLMADGRILGSGDNSGGELADPVFTYTKHPWSTVVGGGAVDVWGSASVTFFKTADQTLWGLGYNNLGDAGLLGPTVPAFRYSTTPVPVFTPPAGVSIVDLSCGHNGFAQAIGILCSDGLIYVYGENRWGALGDGVPVGVVSVPVSTNGLTGIKWIAGGGDRPQFWAGNLIPQAGNRSGTSVASFGAGMSSTIGRRGRSYAYVIG